jgi:hypothetical protein
LPSLLCVDESQAVNANISAVVTADFGKVLRNTGNLPDLKRCYIITICLDCNPLFIICGGSDDVVVELPTGFL